jgi:hypothetical protein
MEFLHKRPIKLSHAAHYNSITIQGAFSVPAARSAIQRSIAAFPCPKLRPIADYDLNEPIVKRGQEGGDYDVKKRY